MLDEGRNAGFALAVGASRLYFTINAAAALPVRVVVKAPAQGNVSKYTFFVQTAAEHTLAS
ncbi:hypothetical protein [Pontibacter sp. H249]|uniref:hypothetical protein n=1 Tax=Pontibacter sp. H249 TaxID=3133420 RepID=UPI0030C33141